MKNDNSAEKFWDKIEKNFPAPKYILNLKETPWHRFWQDLKFDSDNIVCLDSLTESKADTLLLRVNEPEFAPCPPLPEALMGWISTPNWDRRQTEYVQIREEIMKPVEGKGHVPEKFADDTARPAALTAWQNQRQVWRENEFLKERTRGLFAELYKILAMLQRRPDDFDLWLGDIIFADADDENLHYPLILKKIRLRLQDGAMEITDAGENPVFYGEVLEGLVDVHAVAAQKMIEKYAAHFMPLSPNLDKLLPRLASVISPACRYGAGNSSFRSDDKYVICQKPVLLLSRHNLAVAPLLSDIRLKSGRDALVSVAETLTSSAEPELADYDDPEEAAVAVSEGKVAGLVADAPPGTPVAAFTRKILLDALTRGQRVLVLGSLPAFLESVWLALPEAVRFVVAAPGFVSLTATWEHTKEILAQPPKELAAMVEDLRGKQQAGETKVKEARDNLDRLLAAETESTDVFAGRVWSRREMAEFLAAHRDLTDLIPGQVNTEHELPLTEEECEFLYRVGKEFDARTREDMEQELPPLADLPSAYSYEGFLREWQTLETKQNELLQSMPGWHVDERDRLVSPQNEVLEDFDGAAFKEAATAYRELSFSWLDLPWAKEAILAGRQGGGKRQVWDQLGQDIAKVQEMKDAAVMLLLGKVIECPAEVFVDENALSELAAIEKSLPETGRGKLPLWSRLLNRRRQWLCSQITVNGKPISSREDCRTAIRYIELQKARAKVEVEWDQLMGPCGGQTYAELKESGDDVDDLCSARWQQILYCLDWYEKKYRIFCGQLIDLGLDTDQLLPEGKFLTPHQKLADDINWLKINWPRFEAILRLLYVDKRLLKTHEESYISAVADDETRLGKRIRRALEERDASAYRIALSMLKRYKTLSLDYARLQKILTKLKSLAPDWTQFFLNMPEDTTSPEFASVKDAWQYRRFEQKLADNQAAVYRAARELRTAVDTLDGLTQELTEKLVSQQMMQQLAERDLIDQVLGEEMPENFVSVPFAWLLSVRQAVELHLDEPFDLAVIGAAQAVGSSVMPFTLLAKKLILLGDEHQPILPTEVISLPDMPSVSSLYHLYRPHLAHTALLRHYASVPGVIGYANHLFYGQKLLPLRPEGSLSAVIAYDIGGEENSAKGINQAEAEMIVALMAACLAEPEYENKTFGVVTQTEKVQADFIGELAMESLGAKLLAERKFIWGTAAELQGNSRDVMFLSLVKSAPQNQTDEQAETTGEEMAVLTNTAVTLAREQLWVIHSQPGEDFAAESTKILLDYAAHSENYRYVAPKTAEAEIGAEENSVAAEVADCLQDNDWYVRRFWPYNAKANNLAVFTGDKTAFIDLIGENSLGSDNKLPGAKLPLLISEFVKDNEAAIAGLGAELQELGFSPEDDPAAVSGQLLMRVMVGAQHFLQTRQDEKNIAHAEETPLPEKQAGV